MVAVLGQSGIYENFFFEGRWYTDVTEGRAKNEGKGGSQVGAHWTRS